MSKRKQAPADEVVYLSPTAVQVGFRNCCPRCGEGRLFESLLKPGKGCMHCGLNYAFIDAGDGPAVFVILIIGFVVTAMAMALHSAINPPIWVHMVLWTRLIIVLSIWALRIAKGIMIALQYQTSARPGELGGND